MVDLEFGVWGTEEEVAAYRDVVEVYDEETDEVNVELTTYATHRELIEAIKQGDVPDVFLADRADLAYLLDEDVSQPIGERLDERDVDFGDDYSRAALEAFSFDRDLQCMPYGISPLVVYYNTALVDFELMAERGLEVPNLDPDARLRWSFEEFRVAAEFASRPRRGTSGLYVPPTLDGLSPFILSGGGEVYDDDDEPTSLAFSSDDSQSALEQALPILRDPRLTLTADQLARETAATWFERGKLGMIVGDRSLTAAFRRVEGLRVRRHADPDHRRPRHGRADHRHLHLGRHPGPRRVGRPARRRHLHRVRAARGARGLPGARQPDGRADRRLPPADPAAGAGRRVQRERAQPLRPAAARRRGRAPGGGRARDRDAPQRRDPRHRGPDDADRRGVSDGAVARGADRVAVGVPDRR